MMCAPPGIAGQWAGARPARLRTNADGELVFAVAPFGHFVEGARRGSAEPHLLAQHHVRATVTGLDRSVRDVMIGLRRTAPQQLTESIDVVGNPTCCRIPSFMMASGRAMAMASTWSWVT